MHTNRKSMRFGAQQSCKTAKRSGFDFAAPEWPRDFYSKSFSHDRCVEATLPFRAIVQRFILVGGLTNKYIVVGG